MLRDRRDAQAPGRAGRSRRRSASRPSTTAQRALDRLGRLGGRPARAVVVGGGYIGVEMAEAMVRRGLSVTLVDRRPEPMGTLDPDMGGWFARP